jgi:hypothetical protein
MKPILIVRVSKGYNLFVNGVPVVQDPSGGVTVDRVKAGIAKARKKYPVVPSDWKPALFPDADSVKHVAHRIGRYVMNMGDMVFSYTDLEGADPKRFWK